MDTIYHIPDLVQAFYKLENGSLSLILKLAKPLTFMKVASSSKLGAIN